jgi:hypothetical protein
MYSGTISNVQPVMDRNGYHKTTSQGMFVFNVTVDGDDGQQYTGEALGKTNPLRFAIGERVDFEPKQGQYGPKLSLNRPQQGGGGFQQRPQTPRPPMPQQGGAPRPQSPQQSPQRSYGRSPEESRSIMVQGFIKNAVHAGFTDMKAIADFVMVQHAAWEGCLQALAQPAQPAHPQQQHQPPPQRPAQQAPPQQPATQGYAPQQGDIRYSSGNAGDITDFNPYDNEPQF